MKKLVSLILILALTFALGTAFASCNNTPAGNDYSISEEYKDFLVGAVYIGSQNDTAGYTFAHHNGIVTAMKELGIPAENLKIVDNVPEENTQVTNALNTLRNAGCKIIFGISFGYINAFDEAAKNADFAGIILSHGTGYLSSNGDDYKTSFNNYFGRIYQARYLAGIAAGMKSLETGKNDVGYVAAYGTEYAETCSGINAFALGVMAVNPEAKVFVKKINTWGDENLEKSSAEALLASHSTIGIISQHCDSALPQKVAQEKGVFGCGYNSDMTAEAPNAHLTAAIWHWNVYYHTAIEAAKKNPDTFMETVGNYYGGLKEGFVDISALSANCAEGTAARIDAVKALIVSGEWDVFTNVALSFDAEGNIVKTTKALLDNQGGTVIDETGKYFVYSDGALVDGGVQDGVIKGSMNYYVAGVSED